MKRGGRIREGVMEKRVKDRGRRGGNGKEGEVC